MERQFSPLFRTNEGKVIQFFTIIKDGEEFGLIAVDHTEYPSATAYLQRQDEYRDLRFDYVRTAYLDEIPEDLRPATREDISK